METTTAVVDDELPSIPGIKFLTDEESHELFDQVTRRELNMAGPEFLRAWDAGEITCDPEEIMHVIMMIPLGR